MSTFAVATPRASCLAMALAFAMLPATAATAAPDDEDPTDLPTVEVRGALPLASAVESIEQARRRLDERAGATTLVDGERYRDGRVGNLADALGQAAGVFVQPRFGAEESRLSIRGSGLQRTFHGRGLVVLQDGVPLNLADGSFDFQAIEPLAARYVQVWRGANALEAGAATLGGAIDFVSRTGRDSPRPVLRLETGSFGTRRVQLAAGGVRGRADAYIGVTSARQDGFREHAVQENHRLSANAGFQFGDHLDARVYLAHVDTRSQLPGNLTLDEALGEPRMAAPASVAQDQRRDFRLDRVAARLAWASSDDSEATLSLFDSRKSLDHPIFQVLRQESRDRGVDVRWRHDGAIGGHRNLLAVGVSRTRGTIDDRRYANVGGAAGAPTNHFDQAAANTTVFVENQVWLAPQWVLSLGAQHLRSSRRSHDLLVGGGHDESFDVDYRATSPKLGLRWVPADGVQWFGNVSRSAEPPSFGELSGGANVTPVRMQRASSIELGVRVQRERLALDLAAYRARIEGELLSLGDAQGNPLGTVNADRTLHQGIEFAFEWRPSSAWRLSANYLYNDFRFDHDPVYRDNVLAGVPPHSLRAALRWQPGERFHAEPNLEWVPHDYYIDHANTFRAPGFATFGIRFGGRLAADVEWFADLRNLADRRWIASTNVVADAGGVDGRNFLPGDGRSLYVGLEWRPRP
jgi:iron complex outermembrane receptor protein